MKTTMRDSIVYLNGLFTPLEKAHISIMDRGFCYGDGLFETMRACNGTIFRLDQHIDRLFKSLPLIFLDIPMTHNEVKHTVQETLNRNDFDNAIIRLTLTRGVNRTGFQIDPDTAPTLVIHARPHIPNIVHQKGVQISLINTAASRLPGLNKNLKSCNFLLNILVQELSRQKGSMEGIIVDPDLGVTEGATSNIFIVKNGVLKTPSMDNLILEGITRQVVLEIAQTHDIPIEQCALTAEEVLTADEVFITNSGIDIVPVIQVDEIIIGTHQPGDLTCFLRNKFLKCVEASH
ncbi:MAG: hypothetical protein HOH38_00235 [Nitrospinaceae bacterium]|nr:hypothetical protein [Nitrospinaceae bacterium]